MFGITFGSTLDLIFYIIEMIGCISFATSGAIVAIRKKADILGIWILTIISIFGGGLLRDLIINDGPPHIFYDPLYLILAGISLIISTFWFFIAYFKKTAPIIEKHRHDLWIYIVDALGVVVFVIAGIRTTLSSNIPESITGFGKSIYVISLGVLTGIGGGIIRDVCLGEIPGVFKKHFIMTPTIISAIIYYYLSMILNDILTSIIVIVIYVGIRILAAIFKWNLIDAKGYNELTKEKENH